MKRRTSALVLSGMFLLLSACVSGGTPRSSPFGGDGSAEAEVQNNSQLDINVYVVRYGEAERLGTVTSMTRESFRLPQAWIDNGVPLALRVEPIGSRGSFTSQDYVLEPGDVMALLVQNYLRQSSVTIR